MPKTPLQVAAEVVNQIETDHTAAAQEALLDANVRIMAEQAGMPFEVFRRLPADIQGALAEGDGPGREASDGLRAAAKALGARIGALQRLTGDEFPSMSGEAGEQAQEQFSAMARAVIRNDEMRHYIPMVRPPVTFRGQRYHPREIAKVVRDPATIREAYKAGLRTVPEMPFIPEPDVPCPLESYVVGGCTGKAYSQSEIELHCLMKHPTAYRAWTDSRQREREETEIQERRLNNKVQTALLERLGALVAPQGVPDANSDS